MKSLLKIVLTVLLMLPVLPAFSAGESGDLQAGKFGLAFFFREPLMAIEGEGSLSDMLRVYGVSATYQVTGLFAVDPFLFWSKSERKETDDLADSEIKEKSNLLGAGLGLFYCRNIEGGLNLYTGPRFSYSRSTWKENGSSGSISEHKQNAYDISLVFGLKYLFNPHLGLFADIGAGYSTSKQKRERHDSSGALTDKETYTSSQMHFGSSLLGIVYYF